MATCELMTMIDIIAYVSGYVLASKLMACRRDKFIKNWLHADSYTPPVAKLKPIEASKYYSTKQPNIKRERNGT